MMCLLDILLTFLSPNLTYYSLIIPNDLGYLRIQIMGKKTYGGTYNDKIMNVLRRILDWFK